jgi:hypothetical protein
MSKDFGPDKEYWLEHELTRLRAVERVHGISTRKEQEAAQLELARLRRKQNDERSNEDDQGQR